MTEIEIITIIGIASFCALYKLIMIYKEIQEKKITNNTNEKNTMMKEKLKYKGLKQRYSLFFYNSWIVVFSLIICSFVGYYNKVFEQLKPPEKEFTIVQTRFIDLEFNL